jgi:hypothetical protein
MKKINIEAATMHKEKLVARQQIINKQEADQKRALRIARQINFG